jgi:hypothetical protein
MLVDDEMIARTTSLFRFIGNPLPDEHSEVLLGASKDADHKTHALFRGFIYLLSIYNKSVLDFSSEFANHGCDGEF